MHDGAPPAPFLKWAGGKRQLLPRILGLAPARIDTYYEPFVGGGAVFFALAAEKRFTRAVLGDANPELVNCYQTVRDDVEAVIAELRKHRNTPAAYYRVRAKDPARLSNAERAARVIYLNRCGYNGLYRVNSGGQFNVPFGRYAQPNICDVSRLTAASQALRQNVEVVLGDFRQMLEGCQPGADDFVYLDPPYVPLSRTSSFTAYAQRAFGPEDQRRLADALVALSRNSVPAVLSNSYCRTTLQLYAGLKHQKVPARRAINSVGRGRGPVSEILVRTAAIS
ncbi:MAG TPA: DNA adenine methylase [Polyangia bacterium]|jgi:DNA adenine methylase|nr:DNA adenine methylase [Polyangia bacterium]